MLDVKKKVGQTYLSYYIALDTAAREADAEVLQPDDICKYTFYHGLNPTNDRQMRKKFIRMDRDPGQSLTFQGLRDIARDMDALDVTTKESMSAEARAVMAINTLKKE